MHQSFKTPAPPPPIRALAGDCGDFHLIYTSFWFPGRLEVTVFASPTELFAGRSKINLFISWLPTVSFNQCVTLGQNKLFYKGSNMGWKVGVGKCTTHFCPREPRTSLIFTCIKYDCSAQARMGLCGDFKWLVHNCDRELTGKSKKDIQMILIRNTSHIA